MNAQQPPNIYTTPAAPSPNGVYDFNSTDNNGAVYVVTSGVFTGLAAIFVILKLYVRFIIQKRPGLDDLCTIGAFIIQVAYTSILDHLFVNGGARHTWDMSIATLQWVLKQQRLGSIVQQPGYLLTKLALLILFYRLFSSKPVFRWAILAGCFVVTSAYLTTLFIFIFSQSRNLTVKTNYGLACINLITDVYILLVPITAVSSLNLPTARKVGLAAVFAIGLLACVLSSLGVYYRFRTLSGAAKIDLTYGVPSTAIIVTVEMYIGIMLGCFPVLPALLHETGVLKFITSTFQSLRSRLLLSDRSDARSSKNGKNSRDRIQDDSYPLSSVDKAISLHSGPSEVI